MLAAANANGRPGKLVNRVYEESRKPPVSPRGMEPLEEDPGPEPGPESAGDPPRLPGRTVSFDPDLGSPRKLALTFMPETKSLHDPGVAPLPGGLGAQRSSCRAVVAGASTALKPPSSTEAQHMPLGALSDRALPITSGDGPSFPLT
jgi:hypothetical protein